MIITIIGLGLIGGSLALGLRNSNFAKTIIGVENNPIHAQKAIELGMVDKISALSNAISNADLVIAAVPVDITECILPDILTEIKHSAVVVDMGSTKNAICRKLSSHAKRQQFVASHPIAGTEHSGPEAAQENLFYGKKAIICEAQFSSNAALDAVRSMYNSLGAEIIYYSSAQVHDKHVAYVSHMSHISSFMLGLSVLEVEKDEHEILQLAGTGFASTVRLAKSSPDTWTPIFLQNADILAQALDIYIDNLQKFKHCISNNDAQTIYKMMAKANEIGKIIKN
jgi:prephenate dehydrogenase